MPSAKSRRIPKYRHYKPKNLAVVRIDGKDYYLGRYQSAESKEEYARLIAEHFRNGGASSVNAVLTGPSLTVSELILRYWTEHVQIYYRKNGKLTDRQYHIRAALRPLRALYGSTLARDFGPSALQVVREKIIKDGQRRRGGLNRNYVNEHVGIIKRVFRVHPEVAYHELKRRGHAGPIWGCPNDPTDGRCQHVHKP
ncbi:MAG: hypothetical protein ACYSWU_04875, partial [Planctomycetota bacterium]